MDISGLSIAELEELQKVIPAEIQKRKTQERQSVLDELAALAAKRGYRLDDFVTASSTPIEKAHKAKGTRKPVAIKYRHRSQNDLTWTGRGRKPGWVVDWLNQGRSLDELKV